MTDIGPSFLIKLFAPYFLHNIPYHVRVTAFIVISVLGMLIVALSPLISIKMLGVALASLSSGGGESTFLGLTHYYGAGSLAGWGSGTGGAGLAGAGLYVFLTETLGLTVKVSLLLSAGLPGIMGISFFWVLPLEPLQKGPQTRKEYQAVAAVEEEAMDMDVAEGNDDEDRRGSRDGMLPRRSFTRVEPEDKNSISHTLRRLQVLVVPYMVPLCMVYIAEYTINQGVAPTLLFPLKATPFKEFRSFYPIYSFLYQLGVFISRTSITFFRVRDLYTPSILQVVNFAVLTLHALFYFIPSVWIVFLIIFWEGLLGGTVYVNCFASILEEVPEEDREFSLSSATVSDSGGIFLAGIIGSLMEPRLCKWQVGSGRDWCTRIQGKGHE